MKKQLILALALLTVSSTFFTQAFRGAARVTRRAAFAPVAAVGVGHRTGRRAAIRAERRGDLREDETEIDRGLRLL